MKFWLIPIFFIADFYLTAEIMSLIGFWWIIAIFVISFFIGVIILKQVPILLTANMYALFASPAGAKQLYTSGIFYLFGGILFIIPGLLSDITGVLLILYALYLQTFDIITNKTTQQEKDSDVIEAEIISSHAISNNSNSKHSM